MSHLLCIPVFCECHERAVWVMDIHWLANEGLEIARHARFPLEPKALSLPRGAMDVTGQFTVRCPRCLTRQHVLSVIRSRLAAGVGLVLEVPGEREARSPSPAPRPEVHGPRRKEARLLGADGRRAPRTRPAPDLRARASITFDLRVVDISILGMLAGHAHEVQSGTVYGLELRLPPGSETIRVEARVVWTGTHAVEQASCRRRTIYRTGFEFVNLGTKAAAALEAYVTRCLRQGTEPLGATVLD